MTKFRLSRVVTVRFRGEYDVTAKAGTPLTLIPDGMGNPCYAIPPSACDAGTMGGPRSIFAHDSTYYHIWAPPDAVETVED